MRDAAPACLALVVLFTALPASAGECKVVLTGAASQEFPCRAELRKRSEKLWQLTLVTPGGKPFDVGALVSFTAAPAAGTYRLDAKAVDAVDVLVRDKKAKGMAAWGAGIRKSPIPNAPKTYRPPPPRGAVELVLAGIGPEPAVTGKLVATLKADTFNSPAVRGDVTATFSF